MYGKKPVISCAAGIEPAHPTARIITISGSLGRSLLVRVATLLAAFSPAAAISHPRNAPRIDECANARHNVARFRFRRYPSGRGAGRAQLSTLPIAARPCPISTHRGLRSLRSRAPRHAFQLWARRACYLLLAATWGAPRLLACARARTNHRAKAMHALFITARA